MRMGIVTRVGVLIALTTLSGLVGCANQRWSSTPMAAQALPLPGDEVIVTEEARGMAIWVTARQDVELRYQPNSPVLPAQVTFYYRESGKQEWLPGPVWTPGAPRARWKIPNEGRFELTAVPTPLGVAARAPGAGEARVLLTADWTPPTVQVDRGVPAETVRGGDRLSFEWRVSDAFLGTEPPFLEMAEGLRGEWQRVAELPPTGFFDWKVPNRPVISGRLRLTVTDAAGNRTTVRLPGMLSVSGREPFPGGPLHLTSSRETVELPYQASDGKPWSRVELWITHDEGRSWRLAGYDDDCVSPFRYELPEGRWGFQVVLLDSDGNASQHPAPGDAPLSTILVDATPPAIEWGAVDVQRLGPTVTTAVTDRFQIQIPYRITDLSLDAESLQFSYESGGVPVRIPGAYGAEGVVTLDRPVTLPEPLTIQVLGNDQAGNGFVDSLAVWPSEIIAPPTLEFVDLPGGWWPAGQTLTLRYETDWKLAEENGVDLDWSRDGRNWQRIATSLPTRGSYDWETPLETVADLRLRIALRGRDGRTKVGFNHEQIGIDHERPTARVVGPDRGYGDPVYVHVQGQDPGGSGIARVELFARAHGVPTWEMVGSIPSADGTIPFRAKRDGNYYFWAVAVDLAGNRSRPALDGTTNELFTFVAEKGPPGVRLASFHSGGVYAGGTRHGIFLDFSGPIPLGGTIQLEYSTDDGVTWRPITTVGMSVKQFSWQLPTENSDECRIRAVARGIAGDVTTFMSPVPFTIDSTVPKVRITGVERIESGSTKIRYESEDRGGANMSLVHLFYSQDDGTTWKEWNEPFPDTGEIVVPLAVGRYSFALRGEDSARNRAAAPRAATDTQMVHVVGETHQVQVALISPQGGTFPGGSRHYVFWELESLGVAFPDRPVLLEYRVEGEELWQTIVNNQLPEDRFAWQLPLLDGKRVRLRVVAQDLHGRFYEDQSEEWITIDTSVPEITYRGPETSTRRTTRFDFDVVDPRGLEKVELWVRANSTPSWRLVSEAAVHEPLLAELADGQYWVALVGVDAAGNRGPTPVRGEKGAHRILVDTVKPHLRIEGLEDRGRLFGEGETVVIRPVVQDHSLSAFPVAVRLSDDQGQTFHEVTAYHPNGNDLPIKLPEKPGLHYLEVTARDLAGNPTQEVIPVQVIPTPPSIKLLTDPAGTVHPSGSEIELSWEARGVSPIHRGMLIEFTVDGESWDKVASDLPADGSLRWPLPEVDSNRVRLRFTLTRPDGLVGRAWTGNFTVSTTTPEVEVDPIRPQSQPPK